MKTVDLELPLQGRDPLAGADLAEYSPRGIGAWRPGIERRGDPNAT